MPSRGSPLLDASANGVPIGFANVAIGMLNLDGTGDYVQFAAQIVPTSGSYSVALFAERASNTASVTEMISQGTSGGPGFCLATNPARLIRATDQWTTTGVAAGAVGAMTHYALVVDVVAGNSKLYVDGLQGASLGSAIVTGSAGTSTRFGRQFGSLAEHLHGSMDDVRIYSGALTAPGPEPGTYALSGHILRGKGGDHDKTIQVAAGRRDSMSAGESYPGKRNQLTFPIKRSKQSWRQSRIEDSP